MLFTSRFQRANAVAEKRRSLKTYTSADVQRLLDAADAEEDAATKVRILAVAARIDGKTNNEVAAKYGLTPAYISELIVRFLDGDIEGLRGIKRRGRPGQLTPEIIEDLKLFVAKGFDSRQAASAAHPRPRPEMAVGERDRDHNRAFGAPA